MELDDTFRHRNKEVPGITPVSKITRDSWAIFAEDARMMVPDFRPPPPQRVSRHGSWLLWLPRHAKTSTVTGRCGKLGAEGRRIGRAIKTGPA